MLFLVFAQASKHFAQLNVVVKEQTARQQHMSAAR